MKEIRTDGSEPRDESVAMICGYDFPAREPVGRCWKCGGEVWPIEDECWDGAAFHYITFAYECYGCGMRDVADFSIKEPEKKTIKETIKETEKETEKETAKEAVKKPEDGSAGGEASVGQD